MPAHLRRAQFEQQVKATIPPELLELGEVKHPHLQKHYYVAFKNMDAVRAALSHLKDLQFEWVGPTYKAVRVVHRKKH